MMTQTLPTPYLQVVEHVAQTAKGFLEDGKVLSPLIFVGNFESNSFMPVLIDTSSEETKSQSAAQARHLATLINADYSLTVTEAWGLMGSQAKNYEKIIKKYGSIGNSPYREDIVSFFLETKFGVWQAICPVKPLGLSKKKRTISTPELRKIEGFSGTLTQILPDVGEHPLQ